MSRKQNAEDELKQFVADRLEVPAESVTDDKYFVDDLGADALDVVELLMDVEEEFGIYIPQVDAERLTTFGALREYLKSKVEQ